MSGLNLGPDQLDRFSRHIIMDDVGPDGQQALLDASVLVVGAGGLGAPIIQYLAAAGVGRLGIADDDTVERSNLQRQVIHADSDVGKPKVDSAAAFVTDLNPDCHVDRHEVRVTADTAAELIADYDVVVDASDNFPTRYLLNDACTLDTKPLSHGAIYRFEGQVTTFTGETPCYRCMFPEAPPEGAVPDCSEAGVLGVLPGTIGCLQATEVLKLILREADLLPESELLDGRLLFYDAMDMSVEDVPINPNPDCPVCGPDPELSSVQTLDYTGRCGI